MSFPINRRRAAALVCGAAACFAVARASGQDWDQPIPQNPAQQERSLRSKRAWSHATLVEAYHRVGRKDPKWDDQAREVLERVAAMEAESRETYARQWEAVWRAREAIAKGCDDPLILSIEATLSREFVEADTKEAGHRIAKAADAMILSDYPAVRKLWLLAQAAAWAAKAPNATLGERQAVPAQLDTVLKLLPTSVAADGINPQTELLWKQALEKVVAGHRGTAQEAEPSYRWVAEQILPDPALKLAWLHARSDSLRGYAWEARGNGYANTVTEDGFRKMADRLADAKRSIEEAWTLKPGDALTASIAIRVLLGMDGDRTELERWFRRAMEADGNNLKACLDKANWLEPKWYGSPQDLIAFGRRCGDTRIWEARLTLVEPQLNLKVAAPKGVAPDADFWKAPEVWDRCRASFDEYLAHEPDDKIQRSRYAAIAYLTGHHAAAREQFAALGTEIPADKGFWNSLDWMKQIRTEVNAKANDDKPSP